MSVVSTLLLAAAPLPAPLTAPEQAQLRCVAVLAIVADDQKNGRNPTNAPAVASEGARYTGIVGEALVRAGRPAEAVRDWMIAAVAVARREGVTSATVERCLSDARELLARDQATGRQ